MLLGAGFHRGKVNQCLWLAVGKGRVDSVALLVEASPDEEVVTQAFRSACALGHTEIASLLLPAIATKDFQKFVNDAVVWSTARDGNADVLRSLLAARGDRDKVMKRHTLLGWASRRGHVESVRVLLAAGANKEKVSEGHTPLGWASFEGHAKVVQLLLEARANKEQVSVLHTPLAWATLMGHKETARLLADAAAKQ